MKKISIIASAAVLAFFAMAPSKALAQKEQGRSVVNLGVGYSLIGAIFKGTYNVANYPDLKNTSIPPINLSYDFALKDNFSLGIASAYEKIAFKWTDDDGFTTNTYSYEVGFTRLNIAARPLFHFGNNDDLDLYSGLRIGMNKWTVFTKSDDPNYNDEDVTIGLGGFGVQALFGMRYFFNENFGVQTELGIGSPYVAEFGLAIQF